MLAFMALAAFLLAWYSGWIRFQGRESSLVASFIGQSEVCVWEFSKPVSSVFLKIDGKREDVFTNFVGKKHTLQFATRLERDGSAELDFHLLTGNGGGATRRSVKPFDYGARSTFRQPQRYVRITGSTEVLYMIHWHGQSDASGKKTPGRKVQVVVER